MANNDSYNVSRFNCSMQTDYASMDVGPEAILSIDVGALRQFASACEGGAAALGRYEQQYAGLISQVGNVWKSTGVLKLIDELYSSDTRLKSAVTSFNEVAQRMREVATIFEQMQNAYIAEFGNQVPTRGAYSAVDDGC